MQLIPGQMLIESKDLLLIPSSSPYLAQGKFIVSTESSLNISTYRIPVQLVLQTERKAFILIVWVSENYDSGVKFIASLFLEIKFYGTTAALVFYILSRTALALQWQNCKVVIEAVWLAKPKIFTNWIFIEKVY